jgi:hypothetical protein
VLRDVSERRCQRVHLQRVDVFAKGGDECQALGDVPVLTMVGEAADKLGVGRERGMRCVTVCVAGCTTQCVAQVWCGVVQYGVGEEGGVPLGRRGARAKARGTRMLIISGGEGAISYVGM